MLPPFLLNARHCTAYAGRATSHGVDSYIKAQAALKAIKKLARDGTVDATF
jgi:hypothetical protein